MTPSGVSKVETPIDGLVEYTLSPIKDNRGWVMRVADSDWDIPSPAHLQWVQTTAFRSHLGALRGFHLRADFKEWKLLRVISGEAFDMVVDLRPWSASYLESISFRLFGDEPKMLLIPPGCAHAIQSVSPSLDFTLAVTVPYLPELDRGFRWNDRTVRPTWPILPPILSERDAQAPWLAEILECLPTWLRNASD